MNEIRRLEEKVKKLERWKKNIMSIEKRIQEIANTSDMSSVKTLKRIQDALIRTHNILGDVVELGCFQGVTTRFMCEVLKGLESHKRVHVYDSFQGVPEATVEDEGSALDIPDGACCSSFQKFASTFEGADFPLPFVNPGWFEDTCPQQLPDRISMAFLDGDRYSSMIVSLETVIPKMSKNGIVIMHDYACLEGAKKAVNEHKHKFSVFHEEGNQAWAVI